MLKMNNWVTIFIVLSIAADSSWSKYIGKLKLFEKDLKRFHFLNFALFDVFRSRGQCPKLQLLLR